MTIALVQTDIYWEDVQANLSSLEEKIWKMKKGPDVIVLPEMFNTGFSMDAAKLSEPPNLTTHKWMKQIASQTMASVTGSYIVRDNGDYFNRLLWVQPDGTTYTYDKHYLFSLAGEEKVYKAGTQRMIVEWRGFKFCPLICYELRFPAWSNNKGPEIFDCLIYVANWPQKRAMAWNTLLKARSIENLSYTLGVNRIGTDKNGHYYQGDTCAFDFQGNTLVSPADTEDIFYVDLDRNQLDKFREDFPALQDLNRI